MLSAGVPAALQLGYCSEIDAGKYTFEIRDNDDNVIATYLDVEVIPETDFGVGDVAWLAFFSAEPEEPIALGIKSGCCRGTRQGDNDLYWSGTKPLGSVAP